MRTAITGAAEISFLCSSRDGTEAIASSINTGGLLPHLARNEQGAGFDPSDW